MHPHNGGSELIGFWLRWWETAGILASCKKTLMETPNREPQEGRRTIRTLLGVFLSYSYYTLLDSPLVLLSATEGVYG